MAKKKATRDFKIFLVDDDSDDVLLFKKAIDELDFEIALTTFGGSAEILSSLLQEQERLPDIIFFDLNMPDINGHEFLLKIKEQDKLVAITTIVISSSKNPEDIRMALAN